MSRLWFLPILVIALLGGCKQADTPADGASKDGKLKAVEPKAPPVPPYEPKPGETVIKLTFRTPSDEVYGNGDVYIKLFTEDAPLTCAHILDLVEKGYYKKILVHRIELAEDFKLVQFGDANTKDGTIQKGRPEKGSGTTVKRELNKNKHLRGSVGLARSQDPDSGDAQMYICLVDIPQLDAEYAVFGKVVQGLDVVEGLTLGSQITDCAVVSAKQKAGRT
ncbi:MAG: hypothetical protein AMXMBFR61_14240 [Fimbriimonadales bacterium]